MSDIDVQLDPEALIKQYEEATARRSIRADEGTENAVSFAVNENEDEDTKNANTSRKTQQILVARHTHPTGLGINGEHKRRRTSLLGNLQAEGRLSRSYSLHHLTHHQDPSQRQGSEKAPEPLPDDYYLIEDLDMDKIYLEKLEELPGGIAAQLLPTLMPNEVPTVEPEEPVPDNAIFPIQRNTVELQSKLAVVRNLRSYQEHNQMYEGKCYYGEDDVDLSFLTAKPASFLILGKPGIGKTTLGIKLADKMHAVHLSPENVIEYFHRTTKEPLSGIRVNELLENGESVSDGVVVELLQKRIREFDILHRGYVLEGFPMVTSDELPVIDQLKALETLPIPPEYLVIMQMQDMDLFKRRNTQKFDPGTGRVFTERQYSKFEPDELIFDRKFKHRASKYAIFNEHEHHHHHQHFGGGRVFGGDDTLSDNPITEEASDTERFTGMGNDRGSTPGDQNADINEMDFPKLPPEILERSFFRTEDFNVIINDDLESYRCNCGDLQRYVQGYDKRKVVEVDAYWSPTVIFRRVWEFCEAVGIQPVPIPVLIMRPVSMHYYKNEEIEGEDDDDDESDDDDVSDDDQVDLKTEETTDMICEDETPPEIDWEAAMRAVCVRDLVDPRFRWRISRWYNICPVALKLGRTIPGKPELAVTFMDKVFFLSSKRAADQFINSPRPYLLPKMPSSPIKFVVIGHPLAGKTTFAKELAAMTDSSVIDVTREIARRFAAVKRDHMWKKRLKYSLEATHIVNKENFLRWQRQERTRRRDMHAWIENHLRELAEAEIQIALDRDHDMLRKLRMELRLQSEYHAMGEIYTGDGMCQIDDATLHFDWKRFVEEAFKGKKEWTHQECLELAWDLYHQRRLYYKRFKKDVVNLTVFNDFSESNSDEGFGLVVASPEVTEHESSEERDVSDQESEESRTVSKKKRKRKKRKCVRLSVRPVEAEDILEPFLFETFEVDPEDPEVEESVRMRFPMIPFELVDIVPAPSLVGDVDPVVQMIVDEKLAKEGAYADTVPPEIFVEIMRRAVVETEAVYRRKCIHGALTGGWIIDNFPPDIEKWRAVLRTPKISPDQVFLLVDLTEGSMTVWGRFKKLYKMLRPQTATSSQPAPVSSPKKSLSPKQPFTPELLELAPILEEDAYTASSYETGTSSAYRSSRLRGEDEEEEMDDVDGSVTPSAMRRSTRRATKDSSKRGSATADRNEDELESTGGMNIDKHSLGVVSRSHFIMSLLPQDDLYDVASMTHSEEALIAQDLHRNQTAVFSEADSNEDYMEKTIQGYEKYILNSMEKEPAEVKGLDDINSLDSDEDYDEVEKRKEAELKLKPIYGEMIACLGDVQDDVAGGGNATKKKKSAKNPPGTPTGTETGDEDGQSPRQGNEDFTVPVPPEIETGEIPLSPEEMEMKTSLEEDIKKLRNSYGHVEEEIRTPTEMGSGTSLRTGSAGSGIDDGNDNALFQKLLSAKIESPKRKFFTQVRMFNEFWNMALPVCNQQGVRYWDVGLCDEEIALEKGIYFWNELESRFDVKAKKILETETHEEDEEIMASLMKWGEPYEHGDIRYRSAGKDPNADDDDESQVDSGLDDSDVTDDFDSDDDDMSSRRNRAGREKDELAGLENKPDLYWKLLARRAAERCFGDFKYYCPVTYADFNLIRKGFSRFACKYRDRLYYFSNEDNQLRFLTNPKKFLPYGGPPDPPPPRICITGSPGCLQEDIASRVCAEFKVCYVNFRQKLHEIIKARLGQDIGPEQTGFIVPKEQSQGIVKNSKPDDDFIVPQGERSKVWMEGDDGGKPNKKGGTVFPSIKSAKILTIPKQEIYGKAEQRAIQETSLKSLGLLGQGQHSIETIPMTSIYRTELLTERRWEKLSWVEAHIQAFIENGIQLPDDVLDQFILPLWKEAPFTQVGFILVGFPNTQEDIQYMLRRNLIPEHVFVMECKSIVVRNRLIIPAVDRWHHEQNPSGKLSKRLSMRTARAKRNVEVASLSVGALNDDSSEIFPYQTKGRPEIDEFESETWSYNDALSRDISRALKYYHQIYSSGLEKMKKLLNRERIGWTPVDTNIGIHQGKYKVLDSCTSMLKYRSNVFEDTVRLSFPSAQALLDRGVFTLSPMQRWCPVEVSKGNTGINVWNAPEPKKIPYLHRRFIYFVSGEKNAKHFEENTWDLTAQTLPLQPVPLVCIVLGKAKTGKTTLARSLADKLGLLYVSCLEAVQSVLQHAFVTEWAHVLHEVNSALAATGHQPMRLADEILEYVRQGRTIPRFLVYRCMDLYLMNPKCQCNGVVFDDFPTIVDELIELNYREMSPSIVLHMKIPITDAYSRCDATRAPVLKNDQVPEEACECLDYLWDMYGDATRETIEWFRGEYQNIHKIDGTQNPVMVLNQAATLCIEGQRKIQDYITNIYHGKPNTLEGTCPITSNLYKRLNADYGFFCPVALNDNDELVSVREITDLSQVVDYKGKIYLFHSKNSVRKFMANPKKYTSSKVTKKPPEDIPQKMDISAEDWERLQEHSGFLDFDPVLYYANHHYKGLQRGDPKFCVVYRQKLYVFINEENQKKFMRKPAQYWNLVLPMKVPRKAEPVNYDKITPFGYLTAKGMISVLRKVVKLMAEKRPRGPFMSTDQYAALYMGYYLKTLNMNSPYERRQKYRTAMFKLSTIKNSTKDFLTELQNYYGCRPRNLPERLRTKLDEFLKFEHLPTEEKVFIPKIPGVTLGYDAVPAPFTDKQVIRKVRNMIEQMKEGELQHKLEAFTTYSKKKKAAEDATVRAAKDAKDAADIAKKIVEKSQMRMLRVKSQIPESVGFGGSGD